MATTQDREQAIEAWMFAIIRDGGVGRLDDLHIDMIDQLWKPREMWIQGGNEAFQLALMLRDRHQLRFTVGLGFSLTSTSRGEVTGVDFHTSGELMTKLDWSPPSLYLFEPGKEPRAQLLSSVKEGCLQPDATVQDVEQSLLGSEARTTSCYYTEFRQPRSNEYSRTVFLEG